MKKVTREQIAKWTDSKNYKERFKAEYYLLAERQSKLSVMIEKYEKEELEFVPDCPIELLTQQRDCMREYQNILEKRAEFENIDL